MLLVVGILGLLLGLAVPAVSGILRGNEMARALQMIESALDGARQTAITRNRRVEVRFYRFTDANHPVSGDLFRAFQTFLIEENNDAKALSKLSKLPGTVIINGNTDVSSALDLPDKTFSNSNPRDPKVNIPGGIGSEYSAKAVTFRPDGSVDLAQGKDFLTIHPARTTGEAEASAIGTAEIPDYCVIKIDRVSGSTIAYRP